MDFSFYNYFFYEVVIWMFQLVLDLVMYGQIKLRNLNILAHIIEFKFPAFWESILLIHVVINICINFNFK